jgi:molecular chaperone DnaK
VLLPSVVFYPGDEGGGGGGQAKPLVGTAALVAAAAAAAAAAKAAADGSGGSGGDASSNLVRSSKRLMGKKAEEEDSPSFLKIAVPSRPEPLLPQQVATEIISALLDAAQAHFDGQRPSRAVVSVPAYFSKEARAATEEAARAAGLRTVRLVREPVAAALGYGLRPGAPRDETVLVVDLGGGAF